MSAAGLLGAATIQVRVELVDSREPSVRKGRDFSGVVVWLEPRGAPPPPPQPQNATILQKGKRFIPHVLAIPIGSTVDFPNLDPIFHNAFSNFAGQRFDTGLYAPGTSQKVVFRRPGVVRVFCNIHANMSAVAVVLNTPFFGTSDAQGRIRIEGVPEGRYRFQLWHERASEATLRKLERDVSIEGAGLQLPPIAVSESGYLEIPHANKHGREYAPVAPEHVVYPGGRQ